MTPAHITRLVTFAQTGQPVGYAASDLMRSDIEAVLTQPAIQEPIAWIYDWCADGEIVKDWMSAHYAEVHDAKNGFHNIRPLYAHPQQTIPQSAILERRKYHKWVDDDGTEDRELFEPDVACDDCIDVLIIRADAVVVRQEPQPAVVLEPVDVMDQITSIAAARYKVVPNNGPMFWRHAVVAGTGSRHLYSGRELKCDRVAAELTTAFLDGVFLHQQLQNEMYEKAAPAQKPQPKRLTDDEIQSIWMNVATFDTHLTDVLAFARAIEAKILGDMK